MNYLERLLAFPFVLIFLFPTTYGCQSHKSDNVTPELTRGSVLNTDSIEYGFSLNQAGDTSYFTLSTGKWGQGKLKNTLYSSVKTNDTWAEPKRLSFSGSYNDSDLHISEDGKTLFFISNRPPSTTPDIWSATKKPDGTWGQPSPVTELNSEYSEYSPTTDKQGNLYFVSDRPGGFGQGDIYFAQKDDNQFKSPENIGDVINTSKGEWNLDIGGQDDDIIIFEASERSENKSSYGDLYISFRKNGIWTKPNNIVEINSTGSDLSPYMDFKNNTLYYASTDSLRSTQAKIYKVDLKVIIDKYISRAEN